jgi:hypothetical protein
LLDKQTGQLISVTKIANPKPTLDSIIPIGMLIDYSAEQHQCLMPVVFDKSETTCGDDQKPVNYFLSRPRAAATTLRMIIRRLLGAARLTTSGCSSQSRRQASLPPVSLLIRSVGENEAPPHPANAKG